MNEKLESLIGIIEESGYDHVDTKDANVSEWIQEQIEDLDENFKEYILDEYQPYEVLMFMDNVTLKELHCFKDFIENNRESDGDIALFVNMKNRKTLVVPEGCPIGEPRIQIEIENDDFIPNNFYYVPSHYDLMEYILGRKINGENMYSYIILLKLLGYKDILPVMYRPMVYEAYYIDADKHVYIRPAGDEIMRNVKEVK